MSNVAGRPWSSWVPTRRQQQLMVGLCVVWVLAWGLRATLIDTRFSGSDSMFPLCQDLYRLLIRADLHQLLAWLRATEVHPPLPYALATALAIPAGFSQATVRLSGVLLHALAVVQVYWLAGAVRPRDSALRDDCWVAAGLLANAPMAVGRFRLDYPDALITVLLLASLQLVVTVDLRRLRPALGLGLVVGLGALTHLRYPVLLFPAGLLLLSRQVRTARALRNAGVGLGLALVLSGWWYLMQLQAVGFNAGMSSAARVEMEGRFAGYFWSPPGVLTLTLLAALGVVVARRAWSPMAWSTLAATWGVGYAALLLVIDPVPRYCLPLIPLSALLAAGALAWLVRRLPRFRALALLGAVGVSAGGMTGLELQRPPLAVAHRELVTVGMIRPDDRDRGGLRRMTERLLRERRQTMLVGDSDAALHHAHLQRQQLPVQAMWLDARQTRDMLAGGEGVWALLVASPSTEAQRGGVWREEGEAAWRVFQGHRRRELFRLKDATPFTLQLYRLDP